MDKQYPTPDAAMDNIPDNLPYLMTGGVDSVIIGDKDTFANFRFIISDYTLEPPAVKTRYVDIEGGDGSIDLTEALGEIAYENRKQTISLRCVWPSNFEHLKTELSNYCHGKSFDYKLSWDPEYTYHGRFAIKEYPTKTHVGEVKLTIAADPYKTKGVLTDYYNISDGTQVGILSGRKRVRPKFEFTDNTLVCFGGASYMMPKGTYTMDDVVFTEGANFITFIPADQRKFLTYGEAHAYDYRTFGSQWRIFEWYRGVEKWMVSKITFDGADGSFAGDLVVTATNTNGATEASTLSLPDGVTFGADPDDAFVFEDGGDCYITVKDTDGSVIQYPVEGSLPYFNDYPIKSVKVESDFGVIDAEYWTLSVADTNLHHSAVYNNYAYSDFSTSTYGQKHENTIAEMTSYLASSEYEDETDVVLENSMKQAVYVEHEWSDL